MDMKASLDPESRYLSSWTSNGNACDGSFEGVACNERGQVANISLQGKGLSGKLSPAIDGLKHLTGLYLHYNALYGEMPREIANLAELTDLYLNVNQLSGEIPSEIAKMQSLQGKNGCVFVIKIWTFFKFFFRLRSFPEKTKFPSIVKLFIFCFIRKSFYGNLFGGF